MGVQGLTFVKAGTGNLADMSVSFRGDSANYGKVQVNTTSGWMDYDSEENSCQASAVRIVPNEGYEIDWTGICLRVDGNDIITDDIKASLITDEGYALTSGTAYALEKEVESISSKDFVENDNLMLMAAWQADTLDESTIKFTLNANGGTIEGSASKTDNYVVKTSMDPFMIAYAKPVREGHTFDGWYIKDSQSGEEYKCTSLEWGDFSSNDGYIEVFAKWTKNAETEITTVSEIKTEGGNASFAIPLPAGSTLKIAEVKNSELLAQLKKTEKNLLKVFDISVIDTNNQIISIKDNEITIRLLLEDTLKGYDDYKVVYIQDGVIKENMDAQIVGDYLVFKTSHLSQYGIVATKDTKSEAGSPNTGDTGNMAFWIVTLLLSCGAGIGAVIFNRKKHYFS
ncbi:MAG: hypothetical protein SPF70_09225 [Lachnospiraceae bacterium]|nr:hypothetical protein [Lachnospiraceae bacterium]